MCVWRIDNSWKTADELTDRQQLENITGAHEYMRDRLEQESTCNRQHILNAHLLNSVIYYRCSFAPVTGCNNKKPQILNQLLDMCAHIKGNNTTYFVFLPYFQILIFENQMCGAQLCLPVVSQMLGKTSRLLQAL